MNPVKPVSIETVAVENSDDRLAKVEEAKRTGQPLQSVSANKTEVVPYDVAAQIAEENSPKDTYTDRFGRTYADSVESWHDAVRDDPGIIELTNEQKAQQHSEYAAQFLRDRLQAEADVQGMMAEGYDPSIAVQQANLERAREHEEMSKEYAGVRAQREQENVPLLAMVDEVVELLRVEDLSRTPLAERAEIMSHATSVNVPVADEAAITNELKVKDQLIAAERDFEGASFSELQPKDNPAVDIMHQAGSPEELRDSTALAQLRADNLTEEAAQVETEMEEVAASMSLADDLPGEIEDAAEAAVDDGEVADEMYDNPHE